MAKIHLWHSTWILSLLAVLFVLPSHAIPIRRTDGGFQEARTPVDTYTGTVIGLGGGNSSRTGQTGTELNESTSFTLEINTYASVDGTRDFLQALQSKGQESFLNAIKKQKSGRFILEGQAGRDINYVRRSDGQNGRRISIVSERWLQVSERMNSSLSEDFPFSLIALTIDDKGKGQGTFVPAAKIKFDRTKPGFMDVEAFNGLGVKLVNVRLRN
jgi:hypothetical protein